MKQLRDSVGRIFQEYMEKLVGDLPVNGAKAGDVGLQLLALIAEASYTLSGEASAAFHAAMGNCKIGKYKIADKINEKRQRDGEMKTNANRVSSNLDYARKKIREYLDKEIVHINV